MDKQTLSNYGWIIICVLILAVMIALATPFGKFVGEGFKSSYGGFSSVSDKAMDVIGMGTGNGSGSNTEVPVEPETPESGNPTVGNIIPEGGQVVLGDTTYNAGEEFPANETGMIFTYGDYKYGYNGYFNYGSWETNEAQNGWSVRVVDSMKTTYGEILENINGAPVTDMSYTFSDCHSLTTAPTIPNSVTNMPCTFMGCTSLKTAPTIPNSVTNMYCTFAYCASLTTAPIIPNSVTNMESTFDGCTSLETAPTIPSSVTDMSFIFNDCSSLTGEVEINASSLEYYGYCFAGTENPITLTGTSFRLNEIASQYSNVNVK